MILLWTLKDENWNPDSCLIPFSTQVDVDVSGWKVAIGGDLVDGQFLGSPWNLDGTTHSYHPEQIGVFNASNFNLRAQLKRKFGTFGLQTGILHWDLVDCPEPRTCFLSGLWRPCIPNGCRDQTD